MGGGHLTHSFIYVSFFSFFASCAKILHSDLGLLEDVCDTRAFVSRPHFLMLLGAVPVRSPSPLAQKCRTLFLNTPLFIGDYLTKVKKSDFYF